MKVLVIGASRGIGAEVVRAALAEGHEVRAFARSAAEMAPQPGLEPWPGDATSASDLEPALIGVDAVVLALGIKESVAMLWRRVTLFSDAAAALVPLMEGHGPRRLICVTGIGTGESRRALSPPEAAAHRLLLGRPYADKTRQEQIISASTLDWTLVRPGLMTSNRASHRYRVLVEPREWRMGVISRADVAQYIVGALADSATFRTAPVLVR